MSNKKVILFQRGSLCLSLSDSPDPHAVEMLCDTLWGSPGGIRYKHLDTGSRIFEQPNPAFLQLHKDEELLGVLTISGREVQFGGEDLSANYIRYFAMKPAVQKKTGNGTQKHAEIREGIIRTAAKSFFASPHELKAISEVASDFFYAYVTLDNQRSQEMCASMGFVPVSSFRVNVFSRIFTKKLDEVRKPMEADLPELQRWMKDTYQKHVFMPKDADFLGDAYRVITNGEGIVAGARFQLVRWRMVDIPGWSGKFLIRLLPKIPLLRRLINPERFHFLVADAILCKPGHEPQFYRLLSHACADFGVNSAMIWQDDKDADWKRIRSGGRLGLLEKINKSKLIHVITKGLHEDKVEECKENPCYIWPDDLI